MTRILALFAILFSATVALAADEIAVTTPSINGKYQVTADWAGLKRGWNNVAIEIADYDLRKVEGAQIQFDYDMASHPMNPPAAVLTEKGAGIYEAKIFLGMRGTWRFRLSISKDSIQDEFETLATAN